MEADKQIMDDVSKFRITGAVIWLILLVVVVPTWYSNPVNFKPDSERMVESTANTPVVYQAYILPTKTLPKTEACLTETEQGGEPKVEPVVVQKVLEPEVEAVKVDSKKILLEVEQPDKKVMVPVVKIEPNRDVKAGQWLVMVYATKEIKEANKVLGLLDDKYEVWIKEFPKSKAFSVRTGPYSSRELAEKDKRKIDKAIHTQSKIVQVK